MQQEFMKMNDVDDDDGLLICRFWIMDFRPKKYLIQLSKLGWKKFKTFQTEQKVLSCAGSDEFTIEEKFRI